MTFSFGGAPGDIPLLCDFDGDGTADLVIFRAGTWYVSTQRNGVVDKAYHFGQAGDVPLCGDFNADGIADLALFRNGIWFIDTHRAGVVDMVIGFGGVAGEIPVVLDLDGDGRTDIGVFRNGLWYINTTLDGASAVLVGYGGPGDQPLAGYFNLRENAVRQARQRLQSRMHAGQSVRHDQRGVGGRERRRHPTHRQGSVSREPRLQLSGQPVQAEQVRQEQHQAHRRVEVRDRRLAAYGRRHVPAGSLGLRAARPYAVVAGGRGPRTRARRRSQLRAADVSRGAGQRALVRLKENDKANALLTGSSNALFRYVRLNRSRTGHGLSGWGNTYVRVAASEISDNGYMVAPAVSPPDSGKGFDIRDDSEGDARRSTLHGNLTYGVVSVFRSVVRLTSNTIDSTGALGILVCASGVTPDTSVITMTGNWVSSNGYNWPGGVGNGMEVYLTCSGTQTITGNTFIGNALNGLFVASGTVNITNNLFQANTLGVSLYATNGFGEEPSFTSPIITLLRQHLRQQRARRHLLGTVSG